MNRLLVFFYNKLGDVEPIPTTLGDPPRHLYGIELNEAQKDILRQRIRPYVERDADNETIAEQVFHTPLDTLNLEIKEAEGALAIGGRTERIILYRQDGNRLVPFRQAETYAGNFSRAITTLAEDSNYTLYTMDDFIFKPICDLSFRNLIDSLPNLAPVETLQNNNQCVLAFIGITALQTFGSTLFTATNISQMPTISNILRKMNEFSIPYILFRPGLLKYTDHRFPIPFTKLGESHLIRDAVAQHKFFAMEPHFAATLKREKPELYDAAALEVQILTPAAYPIQQPWEFILSNKIIVDASITQGRSLSFLQSNMENSPLIQQALRERKFYLADPLTIYFIKANPQLLGLWNQNFGPAAKKNILVYKYLTPLQQLVVCTLQVIWFLRNVRGRGTNVNILNEQSYCFTDDIGRQQVFEQLLLPFRNPNSIEWQVLIQVQDKIPHNNNQKIRDLEALSSLMHIFNPKKFLSKEFINTLSANEKNTYRGNIERNMRQMQEQGIVTNMQISNALNYLRGTPRQPETLPGIQFPSINFLTSRGANVLTVPGNNQPNTQRNRRARVATMLAKRGNTRASWNKLQPLTPKLSHQENENADELNIGLGSRDPWARGGRKTQKRRYKHRK